MSPEGGSSASPSILIQLSVVNRSPLRSGIEGLLERLRSKPAIGVEEGLAVMAQADISLDDGVDRIGHFVTGKTRPENGADRGALARGAAERDLVELLALLIESQDSDVADMMMAAGVDAAGDVDLERPDLMLPVEIGEAPGDRLRDRNGARRRERAVVEAGAGNDVAGKPEIGGGETVGREHLPDGEDVVALDMRQDEVLVMAHPHLVEAVATGQIGNDPHLLGSGIAGDAARRLERDVDDAVAVDAMGGEIGTAPSGKGCVVELRLLEGARYLRQGLEGRRCEIGRDPVELAAVDLDARMDDAGELALHLLAEALLAELHDQDLDARLELVVAPAVEIVD